MIRSRRNLLPAPILEIGDSGSQFLWAGPEGQALLEVFDDCSLTVSVDEGQVKVSTVVRNSQGNVLAELVENEWKVNASQSFDRNFSADALEVRDLSGDVVLQVRVLRDRVQLQAKFYDSKGVAWPSER